MPYSRETISISSDSAPVNEVFERFKSYLDETVQTISSGLISRTATETHKLGRLVEAEDLKVARLYFSGKNQPNFECLMLHCLRAVAQVASHI